MTRKVYEFIIATDYFINERGRRERGRRERERERERERARARVCVCVHTYIIYTNNQ